MSHQSDMFLRVYGDLWYDINVDYLGKTDPVSTLMEAIEYFPKSVLELGCSNGWLLKKLQEKYACEVAGLDPSAKAIAAGIASNLQVGTAEYLPFENNHFDTLIYGFCFSFIDPNDYFQVLYEGNRVLRNGGYIFLFDRGAPYPIKREHGIATVSHPETKEQTDIEILRYEYNFANLWLAHPFYTKVRDILNPDKFESVTCMHKSIEGAFIRGTKGVPVRTVDFRKEPAS